MSTMAVGREDRHYARLGIERDVIATWEDGLRTGAADGTFEWWYFDCHLDDGSIVTVEFHTKPPFVSPKSPLAPFILLTVSSADGRRLERTVLGDPAAFRASTERCDVAIGANTFAGTVEDGYRVHVEVDDVVFDAELRGEVPPFRPETGHVFFGDHEEHHIAWLPVMARGAVDATLTADGQTTRLRGTGYHDHNWGNIAPRHVLDHWYWGRARVDDYTVVCLDFVSNERYRGAEVPVLMVARAGEILTLVVGHDATCTTGDAFVHPDSGAVVHDDVTYRHHDGEASFRVTFARERDVHLLDFGAAGAYHRFAGEVTVEHEVDGQSHVVQGPAMWELLYFGTGVLPIDAATRAALAVPVGHQA